MNTTGCARLLRSQKSRNIRVKFYIYKCLLVRLSASHSAARSCIADAATLRLARAAFTTLTSLGCYCAATARAHCARRKHTLKSIIFIVRQNYVCVLAHTHNLQRVQQILCSAARARPSQVNKLASTSARARNKHTRYHFISSCEPIKVMRAIGVCESRL